MSEHRDGGARPTSGLAFLRRGGAYVAAQFTLLALIGLSGGRERPVPDWAPRLGAALMLLGGGLALGSGTRLGRNLTALPEPVPHATLVTDGLYAHVRHPIYSGVLALACGWALRRGTRRGLALCGALAALFHFKSECEERALSRRFPEYSAYCRRVKKFVPGVF